MSTEDGNVDAETGEPEPVELEFGPTRVSSVAAMGAGTFAALLSAPFVGFALPFGLSGVLFLAVGLFAAESRRWVSVGVMSIFLGIVIAGALGGATTPMLLAAMVALLVAWDLGQHAITVGEQFGRTPETTRGELVHAAGSTIVGVLAAGGAYGVYVVGTGGRPAFAAVALLVAATLLLWAMRD